jgi:hypothetical protein
VAVARLDGRATVCFTVPDRTGREGSEQDF